MTLERLILNVLKRVAPNALFQTTLRAELHVMTGTVPGTNALADALVNLRDLGYVQSAVDPLSQDTTWTITKLGRSK